jgi:hypothetical protein
MPRGKSTFRQRDLTAALKSARIAGIEVKKFEIDEHGRISITAAGKPTSTDPDEAEAKNSWSDAR